METLPVSHEEQGSSGANPSSVKSDDSSPRQGSGRGSPPPNCAICLGTCKNKSFTDSCLHQFCFSCLLTWSKVKAECPLCKQNFRSIIHNVRSNHQYEEYHIEQRTEQVIENVEIDNQPTRRFRYRTTVTLPRRDTMAIQEYLMRHYSIVSAAVMARHQPPSRRRRDPNSFRRTVYRHNLWARPLPDFTGRFRDCTPEFYRCNDSQIHRLVPWLNRELQYLLNENVGHISYVMTRILELLPQYQINSTEFWDAVHRYFGDRTDHFLHELYCFASTPYDMPGYDRNVQYTTDSGISTMVNEVISSSESDSVDSDIVMISHSESTEAPAGPSRGVRAPEPVYPRGLIQHVPPPTRLADVIPIETISHSDTDDDDVMVVGYIKPPQDRTPEVVDLLGSDSDVVLQETVHQPGTSAEVPTLASSSSLVRLSLKRSRGSSGSSLEAGTPPRRRPRPGTPKRRLSKRRGSPRRRSAGSASTSDTWRTTPSPPRTASPATSSWVCNSSYRSASWSSNYTPGSSGLDTTDSDNLTFTSTSSDSRMKKPLKKRFKRRNCTNKENCSSKKDKKTRRKSRSKRKDKERHTSSRKSQSGKGVKSSKSRKGEADSRRVESVLDQPGTSGTDAAVGGVRVNLSPDRTTNEASESTSKPTETASRSGRTASESNTTESRSRSRRKDRARRSSRDARRLRSVVNVMKQNKHSGDSNSSSSPNLLNILSSAILCPNSQVLACNSDSGSMNSEERTKTIQSTQEILDKAESCFNVTKSGQGESSDSDDCPLNLSVQKPS